MVEDQICEDDKEVRNEHIDMFPYQMNDDDHLSSVECNEQSKEEQPHDDDILVIKLNLEHSLSHLSRWNLFSNSHQDTPRNNSCNVVSIPHHIFGQGDLVEEINHSESSSLEVSVNLANFFNKCPILHTRLVLAPLGDANQVLIFQSTLPSHLLKSFCMVTCEIFDTESQKCQVVNGKTFHLLLSLVHNAFNFANFIDWVNEKLYKDQFHIFSFFKQQMGLISILV